ncbi:MAG: peptidase C39 family protein [Candidatus Zixiibacteriota bacterium]
MAKNKNIRLATGHDLNALVGLEEAAFTTDRFTKDQIEYLLVRSRATTLVWEENGNILGSACVLWRKANESGRLYNLAVHPSTQGKGIGLQILQECEREAARRDCKRITLEVREDNDGGIRFYERHGYHVVTTMSDYYHDGTTGIKMAKDINYKFPLSLKYDIPYYPQSLDFTCGPACLMMALNYFRPKVEMTRSLELTMWKEATTIFMLSGHAGTDGYGLAHSALSRGVECRLVISTERTPMLRSVRTQKKRDIMRVVHNDMKTKALKAGLGHGIYEYGIDEIISALQQKIIPIVLISTYRLTGDRTPHWVLVTGFDEKNIFIHDPDATSYKKSRTKPKHLRVERSEFLKMTRYGKEVYRSLLLVGPKKK